MYINELFLVGIFFFTFIGAIILVEIIDKFTKGKKKYG